MLAKKLGHSNEAPEHWLATLVKVPALWAALIGLTLNQLLIVPVETVITWLTDLSTPVVPLMLISIGMGLRLESIRLKDMPFLTPIIIIKLMIAPLIIILISKQFNLSEDIIVGLALEAGMSSIIIAIIVCDRYHLDSHKFIEVVTLTLLLSLGTLPLWKWLLT